jgi:regulator of protease activity HflC (stomatin/prohibitin superfamily)
LQARADAYRLGLTVTGVAFQDVHPPLAVVDAFRDVSRAESDRQRRVNEAGAYRAEAVTKAKGQADATLNRAEADRAARADRASGEADAFRYLAAARATHPSLTDHRLYWEAVAEVLAGKEKVMIDPNRTRTRHLIVPEFPLGSGSSPALAPAALVGPPKPP